MWIGGQAWYGLDPEPFDEKTHCFVCLYSLVKPSWLYLCGSISGHLRLFVTVQQVLVTK